MKPSLKLFMFYVGGDVPGSNTELHDVRFSIGETPKACYDDLRKQWWGDPKSLHIDSWAEISHADGYDVVLSQNPFKGKEKLYFLNLGAYQNGVFEEVHSNVLVVATSVESAVRKGKQSAQADWKLVHKDAVIEMEKTLDVSNSFKSENIHLHLIPSKAVKDIEFTAKYIRLERRD